MAHWHLRSAEIAGIALSTTSLAVVYAVLVLSLLWGGHDARKLWDIEKEEYAHRRAERAEG